MGRGFTALGGSTVNISGGTVRDFFTALPGSGDGSVFAFGTLESDRAPLAT